MSRSIRKETSSFAFGMVGRFGGSSAGFVVAALNAASATSREVVVLRVLSADILCPLARLHFLKTQTDQTKAGGMSALCQSRPHAPRHEAGNQGPYVDSVGPCSIGYKNHRL